MIRYKKNLTPEEITALKDGSFETTLGKMSFFEAQDFFPSTQPITRFTAYLLCVNDDGTVNGEKSQIFRDSQQSLSTDMSVATDIRPQPIYVLARDIFNITREGSGFGLSMVEGSSTAVEAALEKVAKEGCAVQLVISASMISDADDSKFVAPQITQDDLNLKSLLKYLTLERILETQIWFDGRANSEIISIIEEHISLTEEDLNVAVSEDNRDLVFTNDENVEIARVNLDDIGYVKKIERNGRSLQITFSTGSITTISLPEDGGSDDSAELAALARRVAAIEAAPGGGISSVETETPIEGDGTEDNPIKLQQRSVGTEFLSPQVKTAISSGGQAGGVYKVLSRLNKREVFRVPLQNFGFDSDGNPISDRAVDALLGDIVGVHREGNHDVYFTSKGWSSNSSRRLRAFVRSHDGAGAPIVRELIDDFTFVDAETHGHNDRYVVAAERAGFYNGRPQLYRVTISSNAIEHENITPLNAGRGSAILDFVYKGAETQEPKIISLERGSGQDRLISREAGRTYNIQGSIRITNGARAFTAFESPNEYLVAYNSSSNSTHLQWYGVAEGSAGDVGDLVREEEKDIELEGVTNVTSIEYDASTDHFIITTADSLYIYEFVNVPLFSGLEDTPSMLGQPGQKITPNAGRSSLEWVDDEVLDVGSLTELLEGTTNNQKTGIKDALNIVSGGSSFAFKQGRANPNTFPSGAIIDNTFERSVSTVAGSGYILGQGISPASILFSGSSVNVADPGTATVSPIQFTENGEKVLGFLHFNGAGVYFVAGDHNNSAVEADFPSQITLILSDNSRVTVTFNRIVILM